MTRRSSFPGALGPLVLACLPIAGCSDTAGGPAGEGVVDDLPLLGLTEEVRIGSTDDPEVGFSRVGNDVAVDADDRMYALDLLDRQIRVYSRDGPELHRFGGPGSGPGEFEQAPSFGIVGDTLWAVESFSRRLTLFDREGNVLSTGRFEGVPVGLPPPQSNVGMVLPSILAPDGHFLGHLSMWVSARVAPSAPPPVESGAPGTVEIPRIRFDARGRVTDTAGWYPYRPPPSSDAREVRVGSTTHRIPPPASAAPIQVMVEDGLFVVERPLAEVADEGVFRATRLTLDGDTLYSREYRYRPVDYSEDRLDAIAWRVVQIPSGAVAIAGGTPQVPDMPPDSMDRFRRVRSALSYPAFQPPISSYRAAADGGLWLRREDDGGETFEWLLLDPVGEPVGRLELRREHRIAWAGERSLWVVEPDEFDVPWLVRYRLEIEGG